MAAKDTSPRLKLFHVSSNEEAEPQDQYDYYDSFIVASVSAERARRYYPGNSSIFVMTSPIDGKRYWHCPADKMESFNLVFYKQWVRPDLVDKLTVEEISPTANERYQEGDIILPSYIRG